MRDNPIRLVVEGEHLAVHRFPSGSFGLAPIADVRNHELALSPPSKVSVWQRLLDYILTRPANSPTQPVWVPPGAYLILKAIPRAMQQRYGLEEEEGVVFNHIGAEILDCADGVRFSNGVHVRLQDLPEGQPIEVLSLAGSRIALYEREFQMQ